MVFQKWYFSSVFYGDVINKATKFKYDTSRLAKSLNNLICKGYDLTSIAGSDYLY